MDHPFVSFRITEVSNPSFAASYAIWYHSSLVMEVSQVHAPHPDVAGSESHGIYNASSH